MGRVKYIAEVNEWFDRRAGNTYFSVNFMSAETGLSLFRVPLQYGYGSQYQTTTLEYMEKAGLLPNEYHGSNRWMYERENDYPIHWIRWETTKSVAKANGGE